MKKTIFFIFIILSLAFTASDYNNRYLIEIPRFVDSLDIGDIDLDGDLDVVTGHSYNEFTQWNGISRLYNDNGHINFSDSNYMENGIPWLSLGLLDKNPILDIITFKKYGGSNGQHINIIWNNDFSDTQEIFVNTNHESISGEACVGDIDNNEYQDIVFYSNNGCFWGLIYNQGNHQFSTPELHYADAPVTGIHCADLNNDGRADIVYTTASPSTYICYSYDGYFEEVEFGNRVGGALIQVKDFDKDGDKDIIVTGELPINATALYILENISNDHFEIVVDTFYMGWSASDMSIADLNNDSLPDIIYLNVFPEPEIADDTTYVDTIGGIYILYNQGGLFNFSEPQFKSLEFRQDFFRFMKTGDIDNNGYEDIVIARCRYIHLPSELEVLYNDGNGDFLDYPISTDVNNNQTNKFLKAYPNPFREEIQFIYHINNEALARLEIYDMQGKHINTLTHKQQKGGAFYTTWNGLDKNKKLCKPGSYIATLYVNNQVSQSTVIIHQ